MGGKEEINLMNDPDRYSRQTALPEIGSAGQERLLKSRVVIVGCGALGSISAGLLARAGTGEIRIIDRDFVEPGNLQRQDLFTEKDAEESAPKALRAAEHLRAINSGIKIEGVFSSLSSRNAEQLLSGFDVIIDATDNFHTRLLLNDASLKLNIPWIYGGILGISGLTMNILPYKSACYRCLVPSLPPPASLPTCETAGVLGPVVRVISSLQVLEAMKYLVGDERALSRELTYFDGWENSFVKVAIERRNDCPACVKRKWTFLEPDETKFSTTSLCGRNAFHVDPPPGSSISLKKLAEILKEAGRVRLEPHILDLTLKRHRIHIFADGRAIIKGAGDEKEALSLYARYVGM
jgi:adenylyltransferase/sulfurtransferase